MEPAGSTGDVVVGARAGSGQSQSSRTASWDPSGLDQPADRVSDGLTKRRGLYAEFGSGDRVVEPRVPAKQLNAFAVTWVVPPFGQPTLDGVDEAGRGTDHRAEQDPAQPFALVATVRIARTPDTARVDRHNRRAGLLQPTGDLLRGDLRLG